MFPTAISTLSKKLSLQYAMLLVEIRHDSRFRLAPHDSWLV